MPNDDLPPDFGLFDQPPRRASKLLRGALGLGAALFVAGGLLSGWLFLTNWKVLATSRAASGVQVQVPGGLVVTIPEPSLPSLPGVPPPDRGPGPAGQPLPDWTDRNRVNVLLLGVDRRDDEPVEGSRSDTVIIVSIDPAARSAVMVSLPRDLWVSIPGYGEQRINVAHSVGGPELAMRTVGTNFGLRIDHYARIDFRGFEQIVDTLGGVFIDVERPIKDDEYPTEDYGVMRIYIPPGPQWMEGKTALQYARSRHSEDDFGRARRQQLVLLAMRDRAIQAKMIFKAWELLPLAQKTVATDFSPLDLVKLAKLSSDLDRERVVSLVIGADYAAPIVTSDGAEVLLPDRGAIQGAINGAFARAAALPTATPSPENLAQATLPPATAPPPTRVEVLNGTSRQGLARATADLLRQKGFEITNVDSADRADYADTRVLAQPGRESAAAALTSALGVQPGAVQPLPAATGGPDVRVILGQNFQLPTR